MPIAGASILNTLDQALVDASAAVEEAEDELAELERQVDELVADRGTVFLELSHHYLPTITQQSIDAAFADVRDELQNILARKNRQDRLLQEQVAVANAAREQLGAELSACTRELNELVERREQVEEELVTRLKADAELQELSVQLVQARFQLEENERRLAEIHAEAAEKLPPYENSGLFQYLHNRRFAEPDYRGRGLTRRWDQWVAKLIGFDRARQSYRFLRVTPELADAEVCRRRDELSRLESRVEEIEANAAQACGLPEIAARGQHLGQRREQLLDQLEVNNDQLEPLEAAREELAQSQSSFYDEAISRFKQFLERTRTAVLEERAEATADPTDDEIVAQVKWLDQQIEQYKKTASACRKHRRQAEQKVRRLRYVTQRCQRSNLDAQRCYFEDGFDIDRLLERFRQGDMDEHQLLRALRDHRRFHPTWAERTGKKIGTVMAHPATQTMVQAVATVAAEGLRRAVTRQGGGFTRGRGF